MRLSIRLKVSVFTFCAILLVGGSISLYSIYHWRQQVLTAFTKEAGGVGFSLDAANQIIRDTTRTTLYITLVCLGIGVLLAFIVATHFSRPIRSIVWASRKIGEGKLDTRVPIKRNDELGALADSINQMAARIQRQLHRLAALHDVNVAMTSALDLRTVLDRLLEKTETFLPNSGSVVRLFNPETGALQPVAWHNLSEDGWKTRVLGPRRSLCRRAFESKAPLIIQNLQTDAGQWDPEFARTHGLVSYLGVPLIAKEETLGVISFFTKEEHEFKPAEVDFLTTLAGQAAMAIQNAQLYEQVRAGQEQLRVLSHRLAEAQETERRTISRELHDEIGQALTALKLNLDMSARLPAETARTNLNEAQALANDLIGRVRDLSLRLRPAMLDDLGLLPTLVWHCKRYAAQTKVRVHLQHSGLETRFPPDVATAAYRIVQEALTNVARHSGAVEAVVRLWGNEETLSIDVADQGAGFDLHSGCFPGSTSGLSGMRERAFSLGGELTVESSPGKGTRVTATLPLGNGSRDHQLEALSGQQLAVSAGGGSVPATARGGSASGGSG